MSLNLNSDFPSYSKIHDIIIDKNITSPKKDLRIPNPSPQKISSSFIKEHITSLNAQSSTVLFCSEDVDFDEIDLQQIPKDHKRSLLTTSDSSAKRQRFTVTYLPPIKENTQKRVHKIINPPAWTDEELGPLLAEMKLAQSEGRKINILKLAEKGNRSIQSYKNKAQTLRLEARINQTIDPDHTMTDKELKTIKHKPLSEDEKKIVIELHHSGKSCNKIAVQLGRVKNIISDVLRRKNNRSTDILNKLPKKGRPASKVSSSEAPEKLILKFPNDTAQTYTFDQELPEESLSFPFIDFIPPILNLSIADEDLAPSPTIDLFSARNTVTNPFLEMTTYNDVLEKPDYTFLD